MIRSGAFTTLLLLLLLAGCAPKPPLPMPPDPMTESYLIEHATRIDEAGSRVLRLEPIVAHPRFGDGNATLNATLSATLRPGAPAEGTLFFGLYASRWGEFATAVDTLGERHRVSAYTSGIRDGRFFEHFYITLPFQWLQNAAESDLALLLIDADDELLFTLPSVYAKALITLIDAESRH